ncbi:MAG TPA: M20/M25/M40 family metallo-hydrolase [Pyrinomonadaceae bacterium]|nr:M20/M25/M40 family metallo-hydrolase [Pyrinomonadaceae bacterium]
MKTRAIVVAGSLFLLASLSFAQKKPAPKLNPETSKMVTEVSAKNIEATIRKLVSFGTRNTLSAQDDPVRGVGAARDWLYGEYQKISQDCGGCLDVQKQTFTTPANPPPRGRFPEATVLTNVFAVLKGTTDPDRVYVISGHYDSMCNSPTDAKCDAPGANDDASGTAVSLELARVMSKHKFDATIVFMTVPGEEQGLTGATYYADQAKQAKMNIDAMFTNDIVGGATTRKDMPNRDKVRVFSEGIPLSETEAEARSRKSVGGETDGPARQLARYIKEQADMYIKGFGVWMIYRRDRYGRGGDHSPFLQNGYTAVRITESEEDFTHQHQTPRTENGIIYGDNPEYVDFGYVANVCRVNLTALAGLASAPARPKGVLFASNRQSADTELKWEAVNDPNLAGYEVVWRDTTSAEWTDAEFAGNVTTYTVKSRSKDNYFFGVRSVDKAGNKSMVSYTGGR